jgi:hypothetical protein
MKTVAKIFLSYAREDLEAVKFLYQELSAAGFKPWMDVEDLLPGERWELRIQEAIQDSDFFLVCLSENSTDKRGVFQKEIRAALEILQGMLDSDIYLIPVRLEDCEVPKSLCALQRVDLFEPSGCACLVKALQIGMERRAKRIRSNDRGKLLPEPSLFIFSSDWRQIIGQIEEIGHRQDDGQELWRIASGIEEELAACRFRDDKPFNETLEWKRCIGLIAQLADFHSGYERINALATNLSHELANLLVKAGDAFYWRRDWRQCDALIQQALLGNRAKLTLLSSELAK